MTLSLILDTETTGMLQFKLDDQHVSQPDVIELAAILADEEKVHMQLSFLVKPEWPWRLPPDAVRIHGHTPEKIEAVGVGSLFALRTLSGLIRKAQVIVAHNWEFDYRVLRTMAFRCGKLLDFEQVLSGRATYCTMKTATPICNLPGTYGPKWPKLTEALKILCNHELENAHGALADSQGCLMLYRHLTAAGNGEALSELPLEEQSATSK